MVPVKEGEGEEGENNQHAINTQSARNQCAISVQSACNQRAISMQSPSRMTRQRDPLNIDMKAA